MKLMISLLGILLLAGCQPKEEKRLDADFEGVIAYKLVEWDPKNMDSARAASVRALMPNDSMKVFIKEGSFLAVPDSADIDYGYFNPHLNKQYTKFVGDDSVYVEQGEKEATPESVLLDVTQAYNTDTILGYVCNRLIVKDRSQTKTYVYSTEIATNPEWYKNTKWNHYNVIYKEMKAYYLAMRVDHKDFAFTVRATGITRQELPDSIFPDTKHFLIHKGY